VLFLGILADGLTFFVGFCRIISVWIWFGQTVKSSLHIKLMMFKHLHFAFVGANIIIFIVQAAF
jgi:hypothetical protein